LVQGDGHSHVFPVEIADNKSVGTLKDMIKEKNAHTFGNVDAHNLVLWKVSIPTDGLDAQDPGIVGLDEHEALLPTSRLSKEFSHELKEGHIHIVVRAPPMGE
jgi:hypothetical protein